MNTEAKALADIRSLIANDAYAITFQSLGQYRRALMTAIDLSTQPDPAGAEELHADDGWIKWGGGCQPVDNEIMVCVRFRDGGAPASAIANHLRWEHASFLNTYSSSCDIIAYLVIQDQS